MTATQAANFSARSLSMGGMRFASPEAAKPTIVEKPAKPIVVGKPVREKQAKATCDPLLAAMARVLRDRWPERVDDAGIASALPRYAVARATGVEQVTLIGRVVESMLLAA